MCGALCWIVGLLEVCVLHLCQAVRHAHCHSLAGTVALHPLQGMRVSAPFLLNAMYWYVDLLYPHLVQVMVVRGGSGGMGGGGCGPLCGGGPSGGVSHCGRSVGLLSS